MRCPKCGYISFDHLETCLKCKKDIKSASDSLQGTVYNVAAPAFLKFDEAEAADDVTNELDAFVVADGEIDGGEIEDPDLDILMDDSIQDDSAGEIEFAVEEDGEFSLDIDDGEEEFGLAENQLEDDTEISLDMDDFGDEEDAFAGIDEAEDAEDTFSMDVPEELSDMSDLEPPALDAAEEPAVESAPAASDDDLSLDLDLDIGGNDLGASPVSDTLSLDDDLAGLDLEEPPVAPAAGKKKSADTLNLDDDLDFELDLGDLMLDDK